MFQVVPFLQEDNRLVYSGPEHRRRFFDISCSFLYKNYYNDLQNYLRALKQRNHQIRIDLKTGRSERSLWNKPLAEYGARLIRSRNTFKSGILSYWNSRLQSIGGPGLNLAVEYLPSGIKSQEGLEQQLESCFAADRHQEDIFKTTVHGPHRDNFVFLNNGRDMRRFSSQGEVRLAVLALKLAFVEFVADVNGNRPLLLFDDILLEIDKRNLESLLYSFSGKNQFFFTSTMIPDSGYFQGLPPDCFFKTPLGEAADGI